MKILLSVFILMGAFNVSAQNNGYYVTLQNDTVPATISVKKDVFGPYSFFSLFREVKNCAAWKTF
jgi:hypothetical protein